MSVQKQRLKNVSSILLRDDENEVLFSMLGRGCLTLATGVVQLYTAEAPNRQRWSKRVTGLACFVKDNQKRSYFVRVYDLKQRQCVWEQEIYNQFRYKSPRDYFHTFEAENTQAGLNFASEDEAAKFKSSVEQKLLERHQRRMNKKTSKNQGSSAPPAAPTRTAQVNVGPGPAPAAQPISINSGLSSTTTNTTKDSKKNKKDKKKKLTKEDIGTPSNFRHVNHVGWDPERGFEMEKLDEDMKNLFLSVGINNNDQVDKETIDFIYDFVEKNGGIEQVKREMLSRPPPPPPPSAQPPLPPSSPGNRPLPGVPPSVPGGRAVPPPPTRIQQQVGPPPPGRPMKSGGGAPPPAPPQRDRQLPPTPPFKSSTPASPPPPPAGVPNAPPPPPAPAPPPPPPAPGAPPPPPMGGGGGGGGAGRGALLESIRDGTTLRKTTPGENRPSGGDARDNLLNAIKGGTNLKHVEQQPSARPVVEEQGGIVGALAKALASRSAQIQGSDNDSDDSDMDDDDDEWDD